MDAKFWMAAASYLVLTFVIAGTWHLALFKNVYARLGAFTRPRPIIALGLLSMVLQAGVVADTLRHRPVLAARDPLLGRQGPSTEGEQESEPPHRR